MTIFECKVCGHVEFNEAPEKCLVCHAKKEAFIEKPDAIKKPANPEELSEGDKKHIPQIVVVKECGLIPGGSCTDVHVKVGEIEHVMTKEHLIKYIDFYLDYKFISRVWLSPEVCHPAAALHLNAGSGKIIALENCNVHGNWMTETDI
ncbi:desulfoferrodoxin family protein [Verrucomicrobiota bacterium]